MSKSCLRIQILHARKLYYLSIRNASRWCLLNYFRLAPTEVSDPSWSWITGVSLNSWRTRVALLSFDSLIPSRSLAAVFAWKASISFHSFVPLCSGNSLYPHGALWPGGSRISSWTSETVLSFLASWPRFSNSNWYLEKHGFQKIVIDMKYCLEMLFGRTLSASARRILKQKALHPQLMIPTETTSYINMAGQYWPILASKMPWYIPFNFQFATLETRRELEPKWCPQLCLGWDR